jgi:hypothetical protein
MFVGHQGRPWDVGVGVLLAGAGGSRPDTGVDAHVLRKTRIARSAIVHSDMTASSVATADRRHYLLQHGNSFG